MSQTRPVLGGAFLSLPYAFWVLAVSDFLAVSLSAGLGYCLRGLFPGTLPLETYLSLLPALLAFPALYAAMRLYPGNLLHPAEELKLLFRGTSIGFALVAASFFLFKNADAFSRLFFICSWVLALLLVPLFRHLTRKHFSRFPWWQTPLILVGKQEAIELFCQKLEANKSLGFTPIALVMLTPPASRVHTPATETTGASQGCSPSFPLLKQHALTAGIHSEAELLFTQLATQCPNAVVTVLLDSVSATDQESLLRAAGDHFYRLILVPPMDWLYCIPEQVASLGGAFALTIRRNLCDKRRLQTKRFFDLCACSVFSLLSLPLFLLLVLLIRLDSSGPAFFRQARIGKGGKPFRVYKFRTMQSNAETILEGYLAEHPEEAEEWKQNQKLRSDPRITRVGRFLRKTSLDELPQLINVFCGEMSFVGPRPIVEKEISRYGDVFPLYASVLPGITGLWQISGRNDVSYGERVALDRFYITNWSVWLDIYILVRTIPVVLGRRGAY